MRFGIRSTNLLNEHGIYHPKLVVLDMLAEADHPHYSIAVLPWCSWSVDVAACQAPTPETSSTNRDNVVPRIIFYELQFALSCTKFVQSSQLNHVGMGTGCMHSM